MNRTQQEVNARGYKIRRQAEPGSFVAITSGDLALADNTYDTQAALVLSYTNAGFRGIEARVALMNDEGELDGRVATTNAGNLDTGADVWGEDEPGFYFSATAIADFYRGATR